MPVAHIPASISSKQNAEGQYTDLDNMLSSCHIGAAEEQVPIPFKLDMKIFEEIKNHLDKIRQYEEEHELDSKKVEKLNKFIEVARDTLAKGEEKKATVMKQNKHLKSAIEDMEQRADSALEYWKNYGLDIRQISKDEDDYDHYEFIYSKPPCRKPSQSETTTANCDNIEDSTYTVGIKFHDKQLQIVSQNPEILDQEQMNELNLRIQSNCVCSDGKTGVDYKSAMVLIKKAYIKNLSPSPKIS